MATPIPQNRARFTVGEIVSATDGVAHHAQSEATFEGLVTDSRAVVPGNVFVALVGETHDGHRFLDAAAEKGAALFVVNRGCLGDRPGVEVEDTLVAWGHLARAHLERWREARPERRV